MNLPYRLRHMYKSPQSIVLEEAAEAIERMEDEIAKWKAVATLFYEHHENRRSCSLLASCKQCDAYEEAIGNGKR